MSDETAAAGSATDGAPDSQRRPGQGTVRGLLRPLTPTEARVVAVLLEKEKTVPDTYPMSLNALVAGCNQKTSRDPVMQLGDAEVLAAIDDLKGLSLVIESSGGRVMRYAHNLDRVLAISREAAALLATLILRGPQTAAELRANTERLARFADVSSVEGYLAQLADREVAALVGRLPRRPGSREQRWMHRLCPHGDVVFSTASDSVDGGGDGERDAGWPAAPGTPAATGSSMAAMTARIARLETELAALRGTVDRLCESLGVPTGAQRADADPADPRPGDPAQG